MSSVVKINIVSFDAQTNSNKSTDKKKDKKNVKENKKMFGGQRKTSLVICRVLQQVVTTTYTKLSFKTEKFFINYSIRLKQNDKIYLNIK
jgi:hypothetical protein